MENKFKIGEKVRITKNLKDIKDFRGGYIKELDKYIGDIVTIKSFDSDLYNEAANVKENEWSWDIRAFEKIYNITSLKELQFADVITLRNSERYVYGNGYILGEDNTYDADCDNIKEGCYNDDLTRNSKDFYYSDKPEDFDIVKVERAGEVVYQREDTKEPVEMTVAEISEKLGYEVKIVKEN